jgi:long-chain fatty acid transport protein
MRFRVHVHPRAGAGRAVTRRIGAVALALGAAPFVASTAPAQGFGLNEIGSCAIARAGATTGAPCEDASVVYWNPAAAATLPRGRQLYVGGSAIAVKGSFTRDVTGQRYPGDVPVEFPPFLGATWTGGTTNRVSVGLAAYVPYGLTSQWKDDFIGRFSAQRAALQTIYVQPNIAVEIIPGRLSIGGGPVLGYSRLELRQVLDAAALPVAGTPLTLAQLGVQRETEFARLRVEGDAFGVGANLGVQAKLTNTLTLGARWLSQVRFAYDEAEAEFTPSPSAADYVLVGGLPPSVPPGTTLAQLTQAQFQAGGAFGPGQTASTRIDHPSQFQVGLGYTGLRGTTISADYARIDWTSFAELPVNFTTAAGNPSPLSRSLIEAYEPSHSYRASIEHRYRSGLAARLGAGFATSPAPDVTVTPLLPDMDRYNFAGGVALPFGRFVLDAGYLRVETKGRRGRTGERTDLGLSAEQINDGWYALNANVLTLSLKTRF